jgi:hypothetical protein
VILYLLTRCNSIEDLRIRRIVHLQLPNVNGGERHLGVGSAPNERRDVIRFQLTRTEEVPVWQ